MGPGFPHGTCPWAEGPRTAVHVRFRPGRVGRPAGGQLAMTSLVTARSGAAKQSSDRGRDRALSESGNPSKRLTENEMSDFSRLWHDGCVEAIIESQDVD